MIDKLTKFFNGKKLGLENDRFFSPLFWSWGKKAFLKENLHMVEIEVFSHCNRKCWFCPNSFIDRKSTNVEMPEKDYLKVLKELKNCRFSGTISYSRYNEPLSKEIIYTRLSQARKLLPKATLHTNTNGDYLQKDTIERLKQSGLNSLNIQCYLDEKESFSPELIKEKISQIASRINLEYDEVLNAQDRYEVKFRHEIMDIRCYALNFKSMGTNRGGSVDKINAIDRQAPCFVPFNNLYIDYNGNVMPCCNLRSDNPEHKIFILGNIKKDSLKNIFSNKKLCTMRKMLSVYGKKMYPCNECNYANPK